MPQQSSEMLTWLQRAGLAKYHDVLLDNEFDSLESIAQISMIDLVEMGVSKIGARRKFITAVKSLRCELMESGVIHGSSLPSFDTSSGKTTRLMDLSLSSGANDMDAIPYEKELLPLQPIMRPESAPVRRQSRTADTKVSTLEPLSNKRTSLSSARDLPKEFREENYEAPGTPTTSPTKGAVFDCLIDDLLKDTVSSMTDESFGKPRKRRIQPSDYTRTPVNSFAGQPDLDSSVEDANKTTRPKSAEPTRTPMNLEPDADNRSPTDFTKRSPSTTKTPPTSGRERKEDASEQPAEMTGTAESRDDRLSAENLDGQLADDDESALVEPVEAGALIPATDANAMCLRPEKDPLRQRRLHHVQVLKNREVLADALLEENNELEEVVNTADTLLAMEDTTVSDTIAHAGDCIQERLRGPLSLSPTKAQIMAHSQQALLPPPLDRIEPSSPLKLMPNSADKGKAKPDAGEEESEPEVTTPIRTPFSWRNPNSENPHNPKALPTSATKQKKFAWGSGDVIDGQAFNPFKSIDSVTEVDRHVYYPKASKTTPSRLVRKPNYTKMISEQREELDVMAEEHSKYAKMMDDLVDQTPDKGKSGISMLLMIGTDPVEKHMKGKLMRMIGISEDTADELGSIDLGDMISELAVARAKEIEAREEALRIQERLLAEDEAEDARVKELLMAKAAKSPVRAIAPPKTPPTPPPTLTAPPPAPPLDSNLVAPS
eukprot:NODE_362_length_2598_cov_23.402424_g342_i0.p1 GENE.NODE_362_length_2598_cov_23.402424_g342_i0~~NODE_362_length_2598_cov_23.402424_g342_i0.p1  ORF type:complete len:717 (+),score=149.24 NODE_362_length_2598_cov_23.402424_g342_i0:135-2285(+)